MSIVITTPTGNIGSVVTRQLLDAGETPILIARDPAKLRDAVARGAVVKRGSHDDVDFMVDATRDAEALFVLTPGSYHIQNIVDFYTSFAAPAAEAARANKIPHVVHLSSVGADLATGNGPVAGLHASEQILNAAGIPNLVHLRPGYFMENTLAQIPNILESGSMYTTFPSGERFPMIATRDVGARAAELLRRRDGSGARSIELQGPETSYEDVAEILTEELGREVTHVTVTDEQMIQALTGMGVSQVLADALAELAEGIVQGRVKYEEPRNAANSTPTSYRDFAAEVFKPAFAAAVGG